MKFDHFNISAPMPLLERVRDFYCDVLGLKEGFRPSFGRRGFWLYDGDSALIHLIESDQHQAAETGGYLDHVAFEMTGVAALADRLKSREIPFRVSRISQINVTQLFFNDPAGTGIEAKFVDEILDS